MMATSFASSTLTLAALHTSSMFIGCLAKIFLVMNLAPFYGVEAARPGPVAARKLFINPRIGRRARLPAECPRAEVRGGQDRARSANAMRRSHSRLMLPASEVISAMIGVFSEYFASDPRPSSHFSRFARVLGRSGTALETTFE